MKNIKFLMIGIAAVLIMTTGCEKENAFSSDPKEPMAKNKPMNNKSNDSEDQTEEEIEDYMLKLVNNQAPIDQSITNAVLNVEAALNIKIVNFTAEPEYRDFAIMNVSILEPDDSLPGSNALQFFNDVESAVLYVWNNEEFPGSGEKFINVIDIVYDEELYIMGEAIPVLIGIARHGGNCNAPSPVPCAYDGDYYITNHAGGCGIANSGPVSCWDAADAMSPRLRNKSCNSSLSSLCTTWNPSGPLTNYWYDIEVRPNPTTAGPFQTARNHYVTIDEYRCITENEQETLHNSIVDWGNLQFPQYSIKNEPFYLIDTWILSFKWYDYIPHNPNLIEHYSLKHMYTRARCNQLIETWKPCTWPC